MVESFYIFWYDSSFLKSTLKIYHTRSCKCHFVLCIWPRIGAKRWIHHKKVSKRYGKCRFIIMLILRSFRHFCCIFRIFFSKKFLKTDFWLQKKSIKFHPLNCVVLHYSIFIIYLSHKVHETTNNCYLLTFDSFRLVFQPIIYLFSLRLEIRILMMNKIRLFIYWLIISYV